MSYYSHQKIPIMSHTIGCMQSMVTVPLVMTTVCQTVSEFCYLSKKTLMLGSNNKMLTWNTLLTNAVLSNSSASSTKGKFSRLRSTQYPAPSSTSNFFSTLEVKKNIKIVLHENFAKIEKDSVSFLEGTRKFWADAMTLSLKYEPSVIKLMEFSNRYDLYCVSLN